MPLIAIHYYMEDQKQWSALDLQGTSRFAGEAAAAAQPGSHAEPCSTQQRGCGDGGEQKKREEAVTSHSPRSSGEPRAGGSECNYAYNVEGESLTPKIDSFNPRAAGRPSHRGGARRMEIRSAGSSSEGFALRS